MNPFLKHPILQFVGYEMMKRPTLEGIKANLKKESEKGKWGMIIFPIMFIYFSIRSFINGDIITGIILVIIGFIDFYIHRKLLARNMLRFKISDKEILEQIEIHKEWNMPKS